MYGGCEMGGKGLCSAAESLCSVFAAVCANQLVHELMGSTLYCDGLVC
jgi:hypothetical protein